ncbi:hypothetical protein [Erythrobacter sp. SG61-1L]|uniref:hypothetical protein n=1 Tax=Erythrobacter sp. SG61-1L TaxID=1603897 RepID=UPI000AAD19E1|nr:hypothetical protein [Erythrobacter sp. SG61-1L]
MLKIHSRCDRGMAGYVYPDGGAMLDQPCVLLDAFATIGDAIARARTNRRD